MPEQITPFTTKLYNINTHKSAKLCLNHCSFSFLLFLALYYIIVFYSIEGGHALLQEMSNGRLCIGGVHVVRMAYLFYNLLCFTERHVLLGYMF